MEWIKQASEEALRFYLNQNREQLRVERKRRGELDLYISYRVSEILAIREELNKRGIE